MKPAVFLDRDGTLIDDVDYIRDPAQVSLLSGVREGLAQLRAAGYELVIVTNQSGLGRGLTQLFEYEAVHERMLSLLAPETIDATYFCPDSPEVATDRRKPGAGMVFEAQRDLVLDLSRSWLIGDKTSDIQCARHAGVRPILIQTRYGKTSDPEGAPVVQDFETAVRMILGH